MKGICWNTVLASVVITILILGILRLIKGEPLEHYGSPISDPYKVWI
jgi:hypothetical protein